MIKKCKSCGFYFTSDYAYDKCPECDSEEFEEYLDYQIIDLLNGKGGKKNETRN